MSTSTVESREPRAQNVKVARDTIVVDLHDGRTLMVPLCWYPRLLHATRSERDNSRLIGDGEGIHWPDLDEDISVAGLLAGKASGESQASLAKWIEARAAETPGRRSRAAGRRRSA